MATIKDVYDRRPAPRPGIMIMGGMGGGGGVRHIPDPVVAAFQKIGDAIAEDRGITLDEASNLPLSTRLGPKAEDAFRKFCKMI